MRQYQSIEREEHAANGQRRVYARVGRGELVVVKVNQDATEADVEAAVNRVIAAEDTPADPKPTVEELQAQIAALQAQLSSIGGDG